MTGESEIIKSLFATTSKSSIVKEVYGMKKKVAYTVFRFKEKREITRSIRRRVPSHSMYLSATGASQWLQAISFKIFDFLYKSSSYNCKKNTVSCLCEISYRYSNETRQTMRPLEKVTNWSIFRDIFFKTKVRLPGHIVWVKFSITIAM